MKKIISETVIAAFCVFLSACGSNAPASQSNEPQPEQEQTAETPVTQEAQKAAPTAEDISVELTSYTREADAEMENPPEYAAAYITNNSGYRVFRVFVRYTPKADADPADVIGAVTQADWDAGYEEQVRNGDITYQLELHYEDLLNPDEKGEMTGFRSLEMGSQDMGGLGRYFVHADTLDYFKQSSMEVNYIDENNSVKLASFTYEADTDSWTAAPQLLPSGKWCEWSDKAPEALPKVEGKEYQLTAMDGYVALDVYDADEAFVEDYIQKLKDSDLKPEQQGEPSQENTGYGDTRYYRLSSADHSFLISHNMTLKTMRLNMFPLN